MAKKSGRPPLDLGEKIRELLSCTEDLSPAAESPIAHYKEAVNSSFTLIANIDLHLSEAAFNETVRAKQVALLHRFVLADLIETFERLIKDLAAICVDQLAMYVTDDRYDTFSAKGNEIIAHFDAGSIGKALCESDTWLNNKGINDRYRKLLASMSGEPWKEFLFPGKGQPPKDREERAATLAILWQIRHNLAHNSGVLTGSDAMKLRALTGRPVVKDQVLAPSEESLRHVKRFLTETADATNRCVGGRLSTLLTEIHKGNASLFKAQEKADKLARLFNHPLTIDGAVGKPRPS